MDFEKISTMSTEASASSQLENLDKNKNKTETPASEVENKTVDSSAEKTALTKEDRKNNRAEILQTARQEFNNLASNKILDKKDLEEWFVAKYKSDENYQEYRALPFNEKIQMITDTLNSLAKNSDKDDFIDKLGQEPELLGILDKKLNTLPELIKSYNESWRLPKEEREIIKIENTKFGFDASREISKLDISDKDLENWFNTKYSAYRDKDGSDDGLIKIFNANGEDIGSKKFKDVTSSEKQSHMENTLNLLQSGSRSDIIDNISREPELLAIADQQISTLPHLVKLYNENKEKLED